jgi:hypothetical protein
MGKKKKREQKKGPNQRGKKKSIKVRKNIATKTSLENGFKLIPLVPSMFWANLLVTHQAIFNHAHVTKPKCLALQVSQQCLTKYRVFTS